MKLDSYAYIACATASILMDRGVNQPDFTLLLSAIWVLVTITFTGGYLWSVWRESRPHEPPADAFGHLDDE